MCTRYYVEPMTEEITEIVKEVERSILKRKFQEQGQAVLTSGEIRPSDVVPVIAPNRQGRISIFPMKWGFRIPDRPLLVNARIETAAQKPTFQESWEKRRCVVPASWYYEWEHLTTNTGQRKTGAKYRIQPAGASTTWLGGLYRIEDGLPVFVILTREPQGELKRIHDRMPLILPKEKIMEWIKKTSAPEEVLSYALTDLYAEKAG